MSSKEVVNDSKHSHWKVFSQFSENLFLMYKTEDGMIRYAPLYIHTFRLIAPRKLLDDYNCFLYKGQGKLIREYRDNLGISRKAFAEMIGIHPEMLRTWETDQKRMLKASWEKYFKEIIEA